MNKFNELLAAVAVALFLAVCAILAWTGVVAYTSWVWHWAGGG